MKLNNLRRALTVFALVLSFGACNSGSGSAPDVPGVANLPNSATLTPVTGSNVMTFTVNGSTCSSASSAYYPNKPCVSVTICNPGSTSICQTVNDILLDTGSYGLRVFKSTIPGLTLTPVASHQGGTLAECVKFGDGTSEWGPVETANVILGGEPAITIPIQVIDSTFGTVPTSCGTPDANIAAAKFNGILGVGLLTNDCGDGCTGTHTGNGRYFTCSGSSCAGGSSNTTLDQVQNPVSSLPVDKNGVILELPSISTAGVGSTSGYLIFGIGTEANNVPPSSVVGYSANAYGYFNTQYNGQLYDHSFLDSGSNGLFFTAPSGLPECSGASWYCPSSVQNLSAVTTGADGQNSATVNFQVANTSVLFNSGNNAYPDLGGSASGMFDWGLPFYFGRNVYLGIDGSSATTLGSGMYWGY